MSSLLGSLVFLACTLSMGLMMWIMMGGGGSRKRPRQPDARIAELEREVGELRAQQEAKDSLPTTAAKG